MIPLKVKMVAYRNAGEGVFAEGRKKFEGLVDQEKAAYVDTDPDILFFLSGGSEHSALSAVRSGDFYILITSEEGNSNASALEVKAALAKRNIDSLLLDIQDGETGRFLDRLHRAKTALDSLEGQRLGLIGEVSEWLIASDVKPAVLLSRLGITLKQVPWQSLVDYTEMEAPDAFRQFYARGDSQEIVKAGQVYALLKNCVEENELDALSVECFSLVTTRAVSGCLALAELNREKIPAACEGDTASAAGMMLALALTGQVPWVANIARLAVEKTLLAHCTISPDLISDFEIPTHYETGVGTAIRGDFKGDRITVFRIDEDISKIFISEGTIMERPRHDTACRTQVEVRFPESTVNCLRERPLGNHHLVLPGGHREILELSARLLKLEIVR